MIRRVSPLPAPSNAAGFRFTEIWLVTKDGRFQLDALTEGERELMKRYSQRNKLS